MVDHPGVHIHVLQLGGLIQAGPLRQSSVLLYSSGSFEVIGRFRYFCRLGGSVNT